MNSIKKKSGIILLGVMILGTSGQMVASAAEKDDGKSSSEYVYINNEESDGSKEENKSLSTGAKAGTGAAITSALFGSVYGVTNFVKKLHAKGTLKPDPWMKKEKEKEEDKDIVEPPELEEGKSEESNTKKILIPIVAVIAVMILVNVGVKLYQRCKGSFNIGVKNCNYSSDSANEDNSDSDISDISYECKGENKLNESVNYKCEKENNLDENSEEHKVYEVYYPKLEERIGFTKEQYNSLNDLVSQNDANAENFNEAVRYAIKVFRERVKNEKNRNEIAPNIQAFCEYLLDVAQDVNVVVSKDFPEKSSDVLYGQVFNYSFNSSEIAGLKLFVDNGETIQQVSDYSCDNANMLNDVTYELLSLYSNMMLT